MMSASAQSEEFEVMEMGASALMELAMGGIFTPMQKDAAPKAVEITHLDDSKPSCPTSASAPRQSRTVLREDPAPAPQADMHATPRIASMPRFFPATCLCPFISTAPVQ